MSISRSFATIAFSALPAGPMSLVRTFSSIVSEIVVSCCCALLPKKMIELVSVTSSSRIACCTCCSTGPIQLDLQVAGELLAQRRELVRQRLGRERRHA